MIGKENCCLLDLRLAPVKTRESINTKSPERRISCSGLTVCRYYESYLAFRLLYTVLSGYLELVFVGRSVMTVSKGVDPSG